MIIMDNTRRRQGRPRNPNQPPSNAHLATRKEVLDELDHLVNYSRMPLGRKLESLIAEVKMYRKNSVGQPQISQPIIASNNESVNQLIESSDYVVDVEGIQRRQREREKIDALENVILRQP